MTNEQRAHDLTMLYVQLFCNTLKIDENNCANVDYCSKYIEIYPKVLNEINQHFN